MAPSGQTVAPNVPGGRTYHPPALAPQSGKFPRPRFSAHDYSSFTAPEKKLWSGGYWRHDWHNNLYGWWWIVGGIWYFYSTPIYPYPLYVSDYWWQEPLSPTYPAGFWYYCATSQAYYPYVQTCDVPWTPVSPIPPG